MYKYILFKSFGEVFSSNTTSVVKENSWNIFIVLVIYRMSFTFIFLTSFFILYEIFYFRKINSLSIVSNIINHNTSSKARFCLFFQTLHSQLSLYSIRFNYFSIVHCILSRALFLCFDVVLLLHPVNIPVNNNAVHVVLINDFIVIPFCIKK